MKAMRGLVLGSVSFLSLLSACAADEPSNPDDVFNPMPQQRACAVRPVSAAEAQALELSVPGDPVFDFVEDATVRTIPVAVHVIRDAAGAGDLTDQRIADQIKVLNDAYAGSTGGAKMGMKFVLASTERVNNAQWFTVTPDSSVERDMKSTLRTGGADTLNMYFANIGQGLLGWATFPSDYASDPKMDGVVILSSSLPGGEAPFGEGDTATHEVGHWVGLFHTFQEGCNAPGDLVKDTPRVAQPNFGCPAAIDSCPSTAGDIARPDLITNFMDYVDDSCMNEFTKGQATRAKRYFDNFRAGK